MLFRNIPPTAATLMISAAVILMLVALISYIRTFINVVNKTEGFKKKTQ
ncbi:MAG: hypothetical protein GXY05_12925 [Clostridiales bacterium]|nr:hypothetical protein [Clostridiales bacterium]